MIIKTLQKPGFIYLYLFLLTLSALILKFPNLWFSSEVLAGWDTVGHYQAFLKQADLIQSGHLKGYFLDWFGGMPIFYFYSPLFFWLGALLVVGLPFVLPALIFKLFILLSLAAFTPVFYFFAKTFLPLKPSPWLASLLALLYIFYQPVAFGDLGIGLAGAVAAGLVTHGPGLVLSLLFLSYFKRLLDETGKFWREKDFYLVIIFGAALFYTHTISTIFAAILGMIMLFFYLHNRQTYLKSALVFLGVAAISAYFLLPFISFFDYSSDWGYRRSEGFFFDPLQPLLALDPLDFIHGRWGSINWAWLVAVVSFGAGFWSLISKRIFILPAMFFLPFLVVPRNYLSQVLGASMHYYRMMPLLIVIFLAISLYGLTVWDSYLKSNDQLKRWRRGGWIILILLVVWRLSIFSFSLNRQNINPNLAMSTDSPIEYFSDAKSYPGFKAANQVLDCLRAQGEIEGRVSVESDLRFLTQQTGSAHYFDYAVPKIGVPLLQGLYSESANQTAFIYPAFAGISPRASGYEYPASYYLAKNKHYRQQPVLDSIKQMGLFNVQYVIAYSSEAIDNLTRQLPTNVQSANCENTYFGLYEIDKSLRRPFISKPTYKPLLFIRDNNEYLTFRFLSLGWFSLSQLQGAPIIYHDDIKVGTWDKIKPSDWQNISAIIVGSEALSAVEVKALNATGKKILVLSSNVYQGEKLPEEFTLIQNFRPVAGFNSYNQPYQPDIIALDKFRGFIQESVMRPENKTDFENQPSLIKWQDEQITFTGNGPVIINAAFFPAWQSSEDLELFEVTPGQMLVFSQGETNLEFKATHVDWIGGVMTVLSLLGVVVLLRWRRKLF